jgi:UDP:flavonoid glycosyltransferase YjiC (YdhE family)
MHALLLPIGSTGDVLPFVAIGRALRARGHDVTVAANPHFAGLIERAGLGFAAIGDADEHEATTRSPMGMDRLRGFRFVMDFASTLIRPIYELAAAHRSSLVVAHPLADGARVAEERLGVRTATLLLSPAILRCADTWMKRTVRWAADRLIVDRIVGPPLNAFRAAKGLPPITRILSLGWDTEHLHVAMYPRWFAPSTDDGPRRIVHAGFPLHDSVHDAAAPSLDDPPLVFTAGTRQLLGARLLHRRHRCQRAPRATRDPSHAASRAVASLVAQRCRALCISAAEPNPTARLRVGASRRDRLSGSCTGRGRAAARRAVRT